MMTFASGFRAAVPPWADPLIEATVTRRVAAFLIDGVIVLILAQALHSALWLLGILTLGLALPLLLLLPIVPALYNFLGVISPLSATPGQAIMGLKVRRVADLGAPRVAEALVWVVGFYGSLALSGLPFLLALVTTGHRTLHDLMAGLIVVRTQALTRRDSVWNMADGGSPPK